MTFSGTRLVPLEPWKVYGDAVGVGKRGLTNEVEVLNIGILPPAGRYAVSIAVADGPTVPARVCIPLHLPGGDSSASYRRLNVDLTDGGSLTPGSRVAVTFEAVCFEDSGAAEVAAAAS